MTAGQGPAGSAGERRRNEWLDVAIALGVAAAILFALRVVIVRSPADTNFEFLPEMVHGPAVQSQEAGATTPDGFSDQPLAPGVIVRGSVPFRYGPSPEEAERAGRELPNPFGKDDAAALDRGATVFARCCVACHGPDGEGLGLAVMRGMVQPPSLRADRAVKMRDGQMFHILTKGQGNMASYAMQVTAEDRWKAILHVRKLQGGGVK